MTRPPPPSITLARPARFVRADIARVDVHVHVPPSQAARAVHDVATRLGVVMPISEQIYQVLYHGLPPRDAVVALMTRDLRAEA